MNGWGESGESKRDTNTQRGKGHSALTLVKRVQ